MKWKKWELKFIDFAIENINSGDSIYSQVYLLATSELYRRSWDSIRSKIGRGLKRGTTFKQAKQS